MSMISTEHITPEVFFTDRKKFPSLFSLREYFFPSGCGGCGKPLLGFEAAYYGLCKTCRDLFIIMSRDEKYCEYCGKPLITENNICLHCREIRNSGDVLTNASYNEWLVKMRILFPYSGKFKKILGAYKFGKSLGIGNFLAGYLTMALNDLSLPASGAAWVPVPPRPGKIKKQGWDQIEFMAGLLEKEYRRSEKLVKNQPVSTEVPVVPINVNRCLKRLRSRSQKKLNREERKTNLKGRILCVKKPPATAILFDDVFTTGATMNACAAALLEGGAERVYGVCLFYD